MNTRHKIAGISHHQLIWGMLIVCRSGAQSLLVQEAFQMSARHIVWGDALVGAQFQKIIAFVPTDEPAEQVQQYVDLLKLKLAPGNLDQLFLL